MNATEISSVQRMHAEALERGDTFVADRMRERLEREHQNTEPTTAGLPDTVAFAARCDDGSTLLSSPLAGEVVVAGESAAAASPAPLQPEKKPRKERSDKGRPRGTRAAPVEPVSIDVPAPADPAPSEIAGSKLDPVLLGLEAEVNAPPPDRRSYIGSGDIAAILGLSPHRTPMDVYLRKTGMVADGGDSPWMWAGRHLEPAIAGMYEDVTGGRVGKSRWYQHPTEPWAGATPDYEDFRDGGPLLECKSVGGFRSDDWGDGADDAPGYVVAQVTWQMMCSGRRSCDIARLVGGWDFRIYSVEFDRELADLLMREAKAFWMRLARREPPPLDGGESTRAYLRAKFPRASDLLRPAPADAEALVNTYLAADFSLKDAEKRKETAKARLCEIIGGDLGIAGAGWRATWRANASGGVDWKGLAESIGGATPENLTKFARPGPRVFRLSQDKEKKS